jgi:hypothetical protein
MIQRSPEELRLVVGLENLLKKNKWTKAKVEKDLFLPKNSLSAFLSGAKKIPNKHYENIKIYIENGGVLFKQNNAIISRYDLFEGCTSVTKEWLILNKEYKIFKPIIDIEDVPATSNDLFGFRYTPKDKSDMCKYVVYCYSKESKYLKSNDSEYSTKLLVLDDLGVRQELQEMILNYKIPELDLVIKDYIKLEDDYYIREFLTARQIYESLLFECNNIRNQDGDIDAERTAKIFEQAQKFKTKLHEIRQFAENKNPKFHQMKTEFIENVKSLKIEDIIP